MQGPEVKIKKQKVISIIKEVNSSKDDILDYLKSIGVEASINTTLEPEIVEKVYGHFKKDIEREDKRLKKSVDFAQKYHVDISDAQDKMREEEEEKHRIEEEKRLKKMIEDE
ncbi:MAG: translation initiation factor IF-2 N-terminal domain-containing protein, partial [Ignavibacteria bacterium]